MHCEKVHTFSHMSKQEHESLSKDLKLELQFRYQNGEVQANHNRFMEYTKDDEGRLIIEHTHAQSVKPIYLEYLQGASLKQIRESLQSDGILTAASKARWRREIIMNSPSKGKHSYSEGNIYKIVNTIYIGNLNKFYLNYILRNAVFTLG